MQLITVIDYSLLEVIKKYWNAIDYCLRYSLFSEFAP